MEGDYEIWKDGKVGAEIYRAFSHFTEDRKCSLLIGLATEFVKHASHIFVSMLRAYELDPSHVVDYSDLVIENDASYAVVPETIVDRQEKVLRGKMIPLVKVL